MSGWMGFIFGLCGVSLAIKQKKELDQLKRILKAYIKPEDFERLQTVAPTPKYMFVWLFIVILSTIISFLLILFRVHTNG